MENGDQSGLGSLVQVLGTHLVGCLLLNTVSATLQSSVVAGTDLDFVVVARNAAAFASSLPAEPGR